MGEIKNWREFLKDVPTDILLSEVDSRRNDEKEAIDADPLAIEIMEKLDNALKTFGTYTFGDKGPHEVMDIYSIKRKLETKPISEIGKILAQVLDNYENISTLGARYARKRYESSKLVNAIIGDFDDLSEEDFTELLECDDRFEY